MIAYSHKEEADTKGNSRDPQKKEPVHHRKITRKQKPSFFISRYFKEEKEAIHERFPKSSPKIQGSKRNGFRETAIPSEKTKTGNENGKTGKPVMRKEHKENFFERNLTGRTSKTEDAEENLQEMMCEVHGI